MEIVETLRDRGDITVVLVLHDIDQAARYAEHDPRITPVRPLHDASADGAEHADTDLDRDTDGEL